MCNKKPVSAFESGWYGYLNNKGVLVRFIEKFRANSFLLIKIKSERGSEIKVFMPKVIRDTEESKPLLINQHFL
jgi:Holliday junction resolvase